MEAKHPALTIERGDTLEVVQQKLGLTEPPTPQEPFAGMGAAYYHLPDIGFWVFFKADNRVYTMRFDAEFPHDVEGVRVGDTRDRVLEQRGKPDRLHPVGDKERWIYDKPKFLRIDFDASTNTVEKIFR